MGQTLTRVPQNPYHARQLPHIIGTQEWNEDDRVGLGPDEEQTGTITENFCFCNGVLQQPWGLDMNFVQSVQNVQRRLAKERHNQIKFSTSIFCSNVKRLNEIRNV